MMTTITLTANKLSRILLLIFFLSTIAYAQKNYPKETIYIKFDDKDSISEDQKSIYIKNHNYDTRLNHYNQELMKYNKSKRKTGELMIPTLKIEKPVPPSKYFIFEILSECKIEDSSDYNYIDKNDIRNIHFHQIPFIVSDKKMFKVRFFPNIRE